MKPVLLPLFVATLLLGAAAPSLAQRTRRKAARIFDLECHAILGHHSPLSFATSAKKACIKRSMLSNAYGTSRRP